MTQLNYNLNQLFNPFNSTEIKNVPYIYHILYRRLKGQIIIGLFTLQKFPKRKHDGKAEIL